MSSFQMIAKHIEGGSFLWMNRVINSWPSLGTPLEVFNAFQPHFTIPEHPPNKKHESPQAKAAWVLTKKRAQLAYSVLIKLFRWGDSSFSDREHISASVVANLEGIVWWTTELYAHDHTLPPAERGEEAMGFVAVSMSFTANLTSAMIANTSAIELAAVTLALDCPLTALMEKFVDYMPFLNVTCSLLNSPSARALLLSSIAGRGRRYVNRFVLKLIDVSKYILGYQHTSSADPTQITRLINGLRTILTIVSADPSFCDALRKRQYVRHFLQCVCAFQENRRVWNAIESHVTGPMHWITMHQHRRYRVLLMHEFFEAGGLKYVLEGFAYSKDEEKKASSAKILYTTLGFATSQRVRQVVLDVVQKADMAFLQNIMAPSSPIPASFPAWHDFSESFNARSSLLVQALSLDSACHLSYCNNLNHRGLPLHDTGATRLKSCSRCHSVLYCGENCQREDWQGIHRLECDEIADHDEALTESGFQLVQIAAPTFRYWSEVFREKQELCRRHMIPHTPSLEGGQSIYVWCTNAIDDAKTLYHFAPVEEYRQEAENHLPWSSARYNATVDFVRTTPGTRLVAFVEPCGHAYLHLLCVLFLETNEVNLVPAMAQIELISFTLEYEESGGAVG